VRLAQKEERRKRQETRKGRQGIAGGNKEGTTVQALIKELLPEDD
jgi:hypothetical protein